MFGVIISSRPVLTEPVPVPESNNTKFMFTIPAVPTFSHIVVFLLPGTQLPPDAGAAVYIQLPGANEFTFLGAIANDKQSAIFKVNNKVIGVDGTAMGAMAAGDDAMVDDAQGEPLAGAGNVLLGISLEPVPQIQNSLAALKNTSTSTAPTSTELVLARATPPSATPAATKFLAQRIIENAYNFLSSFSGNVGPGGIEVVPLKSFQDWWKKFEKKVEMDPGFLMREQS